jgi:ferrous-iron efflux pump FieF
VSETHMVIGKPEHTPAAGTHKLRSRSAIVAVLVAGSLVGLKLVTAVLTGSLAVVTSLVDSAVDCVASTVNYFAVRGAEAPPDKDHRWGHGKAESLSGLAQSVLVFITACIVVWQAVRRLIEPHDIANVGIGAAVMGASLCVSIALGLFLRNAGKKHDSIALTGDAAHYLSDGITNSAAIVALVCYRIFGWSWVDPVISFAAAVILAGSAFNIGKHAVDQLMDRELSDTTRKRIKDLVSKSSPQIFGLHALKTRRSGPTLVIEFHLELPAKMSFADAHLVTAQIEETLRHEFDDCMVMIHPEPYIAPGEPLLAGDP